MDADSAISSKRFITLIISGIFIISCLTTLLLVVFVIFYTTKGRVDKDLIGLLTQVLQYEFYIILGGLGFITGDNLASILLEKAKVSAAANIATGNPTADKVNVTNADVANIKNVEVLKTGSTLTTTTTEEVVDRIPKVQDDD
jgi:hypothetical protein